MPRPAHEYPTPAELQVLRVLWEHGPLTVRQVMQKLNDRQRAYTSVMSLMNVMWEKKLLSRRRRGRAFEYAARKQRDKTLGGMVGDLLSRAFDGSAPLLVTQLLDQANPSADELEQIRSAIAAYQQQRKEGEA